MTSRMMLPLALGLLVLGCDDSGSSAQKPGADAAPAEAPVAEDGEWSHARFGDLTEAQVKQRTRGMAAQAKLAQALKAELMAGMKKGPVEAVNACNLKAVETTQAVVEASGLKLGRTAQKLRNSENVAPEWVESFVKLGIAGQVYMVSPVGTLGILTPITTGPMCETCHGLKSSMDPAVLAVIDEKYPGDRATGFQEGDVRGYFWVEIPAAG